MKIEALRQDAGWGEGRLFPGGVGTPTEAARWRSLKAHGLPPQVVIVSGDADQFKVGAAHCAHGSAEGGQPG
jgi:hypothetical protein